MTWNLKVQKLIAINRENLAKMQFPLQTTALYYYIFFKFWRVFYIYLVAYYLTKLSIKKVQSVLFLDVKPGVICIYCVMWIPVSAVLNLSGATTITSLIYMPSFLIVFVSKIL
jgi:hypothetical protein